VEREVSRGGGKGGGGDRCCWRCGWPWDGWLTRRVTGLACRVPAAPGSGEGAPNRPTMPSTLEDSSGLGGGRGLGGWWGWKCACNSSHSGGMGEAVA